MVGSAEARETFPQTTKEFLQPRSRYEHLKEGAMEGETEERDYKVLVVGEGGCGKTSYINQYVNHIFSKAYKATVSFGPKERSFFEAEIVYVSDRLIGRRRFCIKTSPVGEHPSETGSMGYRWSRTFQSHDEGESIVHHTRSKK